MNTSFVQIVQQAIDLLDSLSIKDYQAEIRPHFSSSIGAHMRHIIDHFFAIRDGLDVGHIDYNKRNRHSQIEQFPQTAIASLEGIIEWLNSLDSNLATQKITVTTEIDISTAKSAHCESTLERELIFATSHAIHHYALVRIMCGILDKQIPKFFGYAPATITHINSA